MQCVITLWMWVHQNSTYKLFDVGYVGNLFEVGLSVLSVVWWLELQVFCLDSYWQSHVVQIGESLNVCLYWVKVVVAKV